MAALDTLYDKVLNEAWSKTIAGNGKNTLLVHTEADFKPEDTYYVFVCKPATTQSKYTWQTSPSLINFSVGGNEENWKNLRIIEDRLVKGSEAISYIKNKESKILSGLTRYILDIRYINRTVKDAIYASLYIKTPSGPGRFAAGYYFVNANMIGAPDLKVYYNIVSVLYLKTSNQSNMDPMYVAAETLPYIEDLINVRNIHQKNAEITGIDTSGLLEAIDWNDSYPYGRVEKIVLPYIKFKNPDFTEEDIKDAYSAFYGWLQKYEDLPDDMGVQEWYDNAVENYRDADQYERRGMDEDEKSAAEDGYIDAAENLLRQHLDIFFGGDSEEYKDFLKSRDIHKKGSEISGIDTSGLLEGDSLSFDASSKKFNSAGLLEAVRIKPRSEKELAFINLNRALPPGWQNFINVFRKWLVTNQFTYDISTLNDEDFMANWWYIELDSTHARLRDKGEDSDTTRDKDQTKKTVREIYDQFLNSEEYKDFLKSRDIHKKGSEISGIDTSGLLEGDSLSFDASSEKFNFVEYCKSLGLNESTIKNFADWIVNYSEIGEEVKDYGGDYDESWLNVSTYYDASIENTAYLAAEKDDVSILLDRIREIEIEVVKFYNQYKDFNEFHKNASDVASIDTTGLIETTTEICEQATLTPNGELKFGKYRLFPAGSNAQSMPYAQAINDKSIFSNRLATDIKDLEAIGFKFDTVYYYQPPPDPRYPGRYMSRAIAISGTDNNGEDMMWTRKGGYMAPSPQIYYKDRRGGDIRKLARSIALATNKVSTNVVLDFLKAAVESAPVPPKYNYKSKKITFRPDGKVDIIGRVVIVSDYSYQLMGRTLKLNSTSELPVKFGKIRGELIVNLPITNLDWFPEYLDGDLSFITPSVKLPNWTEGTPIMTPEKFIELGLLDRLTDNTQIQFNLGKDKNRPGFTILKSFKTKADWLDMMKAQDIHQTATDITGIDTSGLLEATKTEDKIAEIINTVIAADNFEDFKHLAKQLPHPSNRINGELVDLIIRRNIQSKIGPLQGSGVFSIEYPNSPQDFFYKALYRFITRHETPRFRDSVASRRRLDDFLEIEQAFNKWHDFKTSQNIHQKSTDITGIDTSGLLESWTDKDIEDYWKHYYNVGDPGPIGAIKDWPGLLFFNKWFVDMIDKENWNVDGIEDYFIEYSDRVADNLEQKDNEDRGYGELQEIACYRGYKKLYYYYKQFLADTASPIYKDWKSSEAIHQKTTDITGIDTSGLLEGFIDSSPSDKYLKNNFTKLLKKIATVKSFDEFLAAHNDIDPKIWSAARGSPNYFRTFQKIFNVDLYKNLDGKTRGNFAGPTTKFGALYRAIERMGFYIVTAKTNRDPYIIHTPGSRAFRVKNELVQAKKYFDIYKDIAESEAIQQKTTDITGIDTSGLLEATTTAKFNSRAYNIYKKALQVENFVDFKNLIKKLPDPWKYNVMISGLFNPRAYIKTILNLKDVPNSFNPVTPADNFLVAVEHILDVEHSNSASLDDIRSGYQIAEEYFAKWLDHKKSQDIHQKASNITGIDTSGLLEEASRVTHTKRRALQKWGNTRPIDREEFARQWALKSGFDELDIENFTEYGGTLIDNLIDWFVDMERDNNKGLSVSDIEELSLEQQIAIYQKQEDEAVKAVEKNLKEFYKDWLASNEILQKSTDITGIDTSGLLENIDYTKEDDVTPAEDKAIFFHTVKNFSSLLPKISNTELASFYNWFNNVKRVELGFGPHAEDNESSWGVFQQITWVAAEDEYGIPEREIADEFRNIAEMMMETLYEEYKAHYIHKGSSDITGIDTSGLLESVDGGSVIRWKNYFVSNAIKLLNLTAEETEKLYEWFLNKATNKTPGLRGWRARNLLANLYSYFTLKAQYEKYIKYPETETATMNLIYNTYLDELRSKQIHQTTTNIAGIDTQGLLESDNDYDAERYWDNALEATATDWINSFKSYVGLERANKVYTWMLNKARVVHDSQATYNNLIDMYGRFANERKKKDGLNNWNAPDDAKVLADIADAYDADIIAQKTTDITDIDVRGLLEGKQYTGPLGPEKDKQGKEYDYQGWYNIIKPFIIDLLKAAENNDFSNFVKIVDSRQKNMGGPGFNPYFNLVDKVYAKVLAELLNNEQAENAFDEAYSDVQSIIVYIDIHLKNQWDRDPNTLQRIPHAQIKQEYPRAIIAFNKFREIYKDYLVSRDIHQKSADISGIDTSGLLE